MQVTATLTQEPKTSGQGELFSQVKGAVDINREMGSLSNDDGNGSVSNFITLIPNRLICKMLAFFSRVEFQRTVT